MLLCIINPSTSLHIVDDAERISLHTSRRTASAAATAAAAAGGRLQLQQLTGSRRHGLRSIQLNGSDGDTQI